jgi:hypothetical protein
MWFAAKASLGAVAEAENARIVGGRSAHQLQHRDLAGRLFLVVAFGFGRSVSRGRHRDVAGGLVPPDLSLGLSRIVVERRHSLVFRLALALERPQGRAPDGAVLGGGALVVGQERGAPLELRAGLNRRMGGRGVDHRRALAGYKELSGVDALARKLHQAVVEVLLHLLDVPDKLCFVEDVLGPVSVEAVALGRIRLVLDGAVVLEIAPLPVSRQHGGAFGDAFLLDGVELLLDREASYTADKQRPGDLSLTRRNAAAQNRIRYLTCEYEWRFVHSPRR